MVIFDWSGVISDDRRPVYESNMRVLEAHGKKRFTFEEWLPRTTLTPIELFANHGVTGDREVLFREYRDNLAQVKKEGIVTTVYPDAKVALQSLAEKGKELVVISSHPEEHLLKEAIDYGVKRYFSKFVGNVKDKAQELSELCSVQGINPLDTVYVGDTIYDIQAAKKAGVRSVGITNGYHVKERLRTENPEFIVDSLTELSSLF
ncbi:MAG: HAD family hydrolase [Candidatus Micrarchaeota archaeon]|nr:HAD family hydrolase [Candidatus Micrarchaeota archaeon]